MRSLYPYTIDWHTLKIITPETFAIIIGTLSIFVLYFFYKSYRSIIKARTIEDNPTAKIRSAAQGYVELKGIQYPLTQKIIIAPLSKLPCTWYECAVERYTRKKWIKIAYQRSEQLFILRDETGTCIINPTGAEVSTPCQDIWMGFSPSPQGKPKTFLGRIWGSFGNYRYREWRMEEGMPLYAIGNFHTQRDRHNKEIHLMNGKGLSSRRPFLLSGWDQQKIVRQHRIDAFGWFLAYFILLACICGLLVIRFT